MSETREDLIAKLERAYTAPFEWEILLRAASAIHDLMTENEVCLRQNAVQAALLQEARDCFAALFGTAASTGNVMRKGKEVLTKLDAALEQESTT